MRLTIRVFMLYDIYGKYSILILTMFFLYLLYLYRIKNKLHEWYRDKCFQCVTKKNLSEVPGVYIMR